MAGPQKLATRKRKGAPSATKRTRRSPYPEATDAVRREWQRRIEAEYRSAAITHHLTFWLIQIGASPDLIHAGLRIVRDELAHARLSHRTFVAAGGEGMSALDRNSLGLRQEPTAALELSVLRACVEIFCLGETVAVPLFKVLREGCTVKPARACLDRVLRDEVRHRDFGWTLLDYLLDQPYGPELKAVVVRELPKYLAKVRKNYAPAGAHNLREIGAGERSWGLMPIARYGEILERAVERDYRPRFANHGIDVIAAWDEACRSSQDPTPS